MSWQATAWAVKQIAGGAGAKLQLLTLANYADADGCCWPSQEVLAADTEQSVDTVQRQLKKLIAAGLIRKVPRAQGAGRWDSRTYFLNMPVAEMSKPQSAARSEDEPNRLERYASVTLAEPTMPQGARDHAATDTPTMPHQARDHAAPVRCKPSLEPSLEASASSIPNSTGSPADAAPAPKPPRPSVAERQKAFRVGRKGVEIIQNRIAKKIGFDGWEILQSLNDRDLQMVTVLEERGQLDASAIALLRQRKPQQVPA
jgi:hypothetical protein